MQMVVHATPCILPFGPCSNRSSDAVMPNTLPPAIAPSNLALRAVSRSGSGDWILLVVDVQLNQVIEEIVENVRAFGGQVSVSDMTGRSVQEVIATMATCARRTILLIHGLDGLTDEDWQHIDLLRSRLIGAGTIVLPVSLMTAERISRSAPNLSSWIGGAMWTLNPTADLVSDAERNKRLKVLRRWAKMTDEQVIRRAKDGSLPDDPEYTEWLILLDRADLVAS